MDDKTEEEEESCELPGWARDMGPLISFSFSSRWQLVSLSNILNVNNVIIIKSSPLYNGPQLTVFLSVCISDYNLISPDLQIRDCGGGPGAEPQ